MVETVLVAGMGFTEEERVQESAQRLGVKYTVRKKGETMGGPALVAEDNSEKRRLRNSGYMYHAVEVGSKEYDELRL